jgi:hypothetical protein
VKFVDGLANVAGKYAPTPTTTELVAPALVDPYDLLAKVLAVQQPQKRFRHAFDPLKYILFETNFSRKLPFGKASERLISSIRPHIITRAPILRFLITASWIEPPVLSKKTSTPLGHASFTAAVSSEAFL